jgi:hypothetical protein
MFLCGVSVYIGWENRRRMEGRNEEKIGVRIRKYGVGSKLLAGGGEYQTWMDGWAAESFRPWLSLGGECGPSLTNFGAACPNPANRVKCSS